MKRHAWCAELTEEKRDLLEFDEFADMLHCPWRTEGIVERDVVDSSAIDPAPVIDRLHVGEKAFADETD